MRISFIFFYLSFIVSAKKHKFISSDESDEIVPFVDTYLDLRGGIRKQFALEAAFVDHARNMICSPMSVLMPLGKLVLGAEKESEEELLEAVGLRSRKQLKNAFTQLISNMEYLPGVTLDVASKIFVGSDKSVDRKFKKRSKQIFRSSCERIEPSDPSRTARIINDWVAEKTRNKIRTLVRSSDISRSTSLILVNAIYFAGTWKETFGQARSSEFHSPSGSRRIPMMSRQGQYNYRKCDTLNAQVIEIPYEGGQAAMIIVLPFSNNGLPVLLRALKLAPELLNQALERMKEVDLILSIPKFKIETELDLASLYRKVGLRSIFDPRRSDLKNIIKGEKLYVSKAVHKAVIEVNERGTVASAATGAHIRPEQGIPNMPIFNANRPFAFYVVYYKQQLFAGIFSGYKNVANKNQNIPENADVKLQCTTLHICTGIIIGHGSAPTPYQMIEFSADHPFLFYITTFKEQLFAGIFTG